MLNWSKARAAAAYAAIFVTAACGTEPIDEPIGEPSADGIEILTQDEGGITGTLARDGITLRFETHAGPVARVVDDRGRTIAIGLNGNPMPPAWGMPEDIAPDDPARLALGDAAASLSALALPENLQAHARAVAGIAEAVPAILDVESRIATDPDANAAAVQQLAPDVQTAIADYYNVLASEPMARRAYELNPNAIEKELPAVYASGCAYFDRYKQNNTLGGFTAFRFHQWRSWCWSSSHYMATPGDRGSYPSNVNSTFDYDGWWVNADYWTTPHYQHFYFTQAKFRNCIFKYGCTSTYYPWMKSWVDGWGSYTTQKGG